LALVHFAAEPGKVYYFRTKFLVGILDANLELDQLDSDEAKYLIASYPICIAHLLGR